MLRQVMGYHWITRIPPPTLQPPPVHVGDAAAALPAASPSNAVEATSEAVAAS